MECRTTLFGNYPSLFLVMILLGWGSQAFSQVVSEELLEGLTLRSIGPAVMGGRIDAVAVDPAHPWVIYVGTASGGLWKTINNGTTWKPVFDDQGTSSIGAVALAPSDPEVVWVGTGEANNRQSSTFGDGVYKSLDGGATWTHVGLPETQHIGRIRVHPSNPGIAYVAALGKLWGANPERGVFRTTDGGKTWQKVLFIDIDTGVVDLAMDPLNSDILYAAAYQRRRTSWGFSGGGPGSGLYKTTDGGDTWKRLSRGLPEGPMGRIGLDVYQADPKIVCALVEHPKGGLFRSQDRGESWTKINDLNPRPMYYSQIRIDPSDSQRIYVLGGSFYFSEDGAKTFTENTEMTPTYDVGVHGDHHELWIDPSNGKHLILGGDGGLYFSWDRSKTWEKINNLPIAQFYSVGLDMQQPYFIYGGAQDTHSWGGPSATRNQIGILNSDWYQINFGDGMYQRVDPTDPNTVYTESQGGSIIRFDRRSGARKTIKPEPEEGEDPYRFNWTAPIEISPHDPDMILLGGNRLFLSKDRGESWMATEDLSLGGDRSELPIMGEVPDENTLSLNDGVSSWGTITTITESPLKAGVIFVGTDDGLVQRSLDGARTWTSLEGRFPGLDGNGASVSRVLASRGSADRAYATFDRHQADDFAPYIFTSDDLGGTWRSISSNLPPVGWVNVIAEHPQNPDLLFAGTETGLFVSIDRGGGWTRLKGNFPTVPVDDLKIHPRDDDLVVATHGRSIYVLDDLSALVELTPETLSTAAHLFDLRPATERLYWKQESYGGQGQFVGTNPPDGAIVSYFLGRDPGSDAVQCEDVGLRVLDGDGKVLRHLEAGQAPRMNRVVWDLRTDPPEGVSGSRGPQVPPGEYSLELTACGQTQQSSLRVLMDSRVDVSPQELQDRYEFLLELNRLRETVQRLVSASEKVSKDVEGFLNRPDLENLPEDLTTAAKEIAEESGRIRTSLVGQGRRGGGGRNRGIRSPASGLFGELDGDQVRQATFAGPTTTQKRRLASLNSQLDEAIAALNKVLEQRLPDLNRRIRAANLPWIPVAEAIKRSP